MFGSVNSQWHRARLAHANMIRLLAAGASTVVLVTLMSEVKAEVLLFAANSANYIQNITAPAGDFVDFNGPTAGGKSYTFQTSQANQRVLITFEATCYKSVPGPPIVNILVDPADSVGELAAPPTNSTFEGGVILCAFGSDDPGFHVVHTSITASARPAQAGTHSVRVRVRLVTPGDEVAIGTAFLAVSR
jgi:hypothetical protein